MPATYEPIATTTLGSAASSITFSSIPGTYTDLRLVVVAKAVSSGNGLIARVNSDSATNYSWTSLRGSGTAAESATTPDDNYTLSAYYSLSTSQFALSTLDIFSYAGNTNKTALMEYSGDFNGSGNVIRTVNLWRNTSAISSLEVKCSGASNLAVGTTATLYGILKA